jgi:hypothetical protein
MQSVSTTVRTLPHLQLNLCTTFVCLYVCVPVCVIASHNGFLFYVLPFARALAAQTLLHLDTVSRSFFFVLHLPSVLHIRNVRLCVKRNSHLGRHAIECVCLCYWVAPHIGSSRNVRLCVKELSLGNVRLCVKRNSHLRRVHFKGNCGQTASS